MSRPVIVRLSFDVLQQRAGMNRCQMARAIGMHRAALAHAAAIGLSHDQADRYAVALGYHPLEIWPDFHDDVEVDAS